VIVERSMFPETRSKSPRKRSSQQHPLSGVFAPKKHCVIHVISSTAVATRGGGSGASTGAARISFGFAVSASPVPSPPSGAGSFVSDVVFVGVGSMPEIQVPAAPSKWPENNLLQTAGGYFKTPLRSMTAIVLN
jgi:hypothetical protein